MPSDIRRRLAALEAKLRFASVPQIPDNPTWFEQLAHRIAYSSNCDWRAAVDKAVQVERFLLAVDELHGGGVSLSEAEIQTAADAALAA